MYTLYMHPAKILARINIIFPVFADYNDSQLEKSTCREQVVKVMSLTWNNASWITERSSDNLRCKMPM